MKCKLLILCAYFAIVQLGTCQSTRRTIVFTGCPPLKVKYGRARIRARVFAQFSCSKGYLLAGDRYIKCLQGRWDSEPPVCVRPTCQKPPQLKNGVIHKSHRGGVLNFYCGANYILEGPKQAYCVDMKWNTHLPSCLPADTTPSLSCDFETEDVCGWSHDLNHNFDWTRLNNRTPSGHLATGPSYDHTKGPAGRGYYMYIEGSTKHINDTARLISPMYKKESNNTCLEFYYHMYGSGIGELRVYVKKINESWDLKLQDAIFVKDGNQGNEWWRGFVELGSIGDQFQVIFEGVRGFSFISDIAIDDVKIIENCVIDTIATTEADMGESTFVYDSCSGKCNTTTTTTTDVSCGCDENCIDNNFCCADYVAVCVLGNDTDTTDTDFDDSTTESTEELTSIPLFINNLTTRIKPPLFNPTTRLPITIVTTTSPPKLIPRPTMNVAMNFTTKFPRLPPFVYIPPSTTTSSTTERIKIITMANDIQGMTDRRIPIKTTQINGIPTRPARPSFPTTTTPTPTTAIVRRTTISKYFLNDMLTVPNEDQDFIVITETPTTIPKEYPRDDQSNRILLSDKVAPVHEKPAPSNKTTVIAVLTVCFIIIGILMLVFLAKRFKSKNWMRVRRIRSGNGDSQSDVRFLTGDEILDFTMARPVSDY